MTEGTEAEGAEAEGAEAEGSRAEGSSAAAAPAAGNGDALVMTGPKPVHSGTAGAQTATAKKVLVVDIGGNSVKLLATGQEVHRSFPSGPDMTPQDMVCGVKQLTEDWEHEVVSIGYPGVVVRGRPIAEPRNLGHGWVAFDFAAAFGLPVRIVNDAAMQALGSYRGGKMLFLGLGTGLGSAMVVNGVLEPMELGQLPYKKGNYEDYLGRKGLKQHGRKRWRRHVAEATAQLIAALEPDETVLGGGNVKKLETIPPGVRAGSNADAFRGGFRLWQAD